MVGFEPEGSWQQLAVPCDHQPTKPRSDSALISGFDPHSAPSVSDSQAAAISTFVQENALSHHRQRTAMGQRGLTATTSWQ